TQQASTQLFGAGTISIPLDSADPLPGPAVAWTALDGVVLDAAAMARIDHDRRSTLLAGGVVLAVAADAMPDTVWPWRREGSLWVLRHLPVGPADQPVDERAYAPTAAW